jgi:hypothetical protein
MPSLFEVLHSHHASFVQRVKSCFLMCFLQSRTTLSCCRHPQAHDNQIAGIYRTCYDDSPSKALPPRVPGPQRERVRITIDRDELFFKARRPTPIDTVARERRSARGGQRGGPRIPPRIFLEAPGRRAAPRRRRRATAARVWPCVWVLLASSCAVLIGRSLAVAGVAGGDTARASSAGAAAAAAAGWLAAAAPGLQGRPRPSPAEDMSTSGGGASAALLAFDPWEHVAEPRTDGLGARTRDSTDSLAL